MSRLCWLRTSLLAMISTLAIGAHHLPSMSCQPPAFFGSSCGSFLLFLFGLPGPTLTGGGCSGMSFLGQCLSPTQGDIEPS